MEALSGPLRELPILKYVLPELKSQHGRTRSMTRTLIAPLRGTKLV